MHQYHKVGVAYIMIMHGSEHAQVGNASVSGRIPPKTGCLNSLDWNGGMEWWNGMVVWNGGLDWNSGMEGWCACSVPMNLWN